MLEDDRPASAEPAAWLSWTTQKQATASDPARSAWVSANAGSGKTHVLTQRVIRLLLAGCRPSAILCLTYTKAAASEMSNRVFERLAEWATLSDEILSERVAAIEGREPNLFKLAEARRLFARALETPGGLKIQTIHAFCEALLHQFPLEANVAGHFSVLDDRAAAVLLADARRTLLTATTNEDDSTLAAAFATVLDIADDTGLERLIADIVASRGQIREFLDGAAKAGGMDAVLRRETGLDPNETADDILAAFWPLDGLQGAVLESYLAAAESLGSETVKTSAAGLRGVARLTDAEAQRAALHDLFFTGTGSPRSLDRSFLSKKVRDSAPHFETALLAAQAHVVACDDRLRRFRMYEATRAALVIAERLIGDYEDLKRARSLLDFDDLIDRTARLLTREKVSAWVHYKLDQGIDHILVDEAQDTSPRQWQIVKSLTDDFFAGETARNRNRTIFAVGDEKQSIYSFQGARPERFAEEGRTVLRRTQAAEAAFSPIRLLLSFRSTREVLSAVDQVFLDPANARGLTPDGSEIVHASNRGREPGAVDIWEVIAAPPGLDEEDWTAPFDAVAEEAPINVLARRIADTLAAWIGRETVTEKGKTRPMAAGDVIVLVRKRDAFVNALTRTLKQRHNLPVAGADRLVLTKHIAVQDLMALGRFAVLPEDDLSLAALLKSPLFNLDEEALFALAARRGERQGLWARLTEAAEEDAVLAGIVRRLRDVLRDAQGQAVHDFYARILGAGGGRRAFLARLGTEAGEIIDEFLTFALEQEENGLPGLQAFVSTLELEAPTVKREQDKARGEIRIMTVHAAKGLEAPVVFLADGGAKPFSPSHMPHLRFLSAPGLAGGLPAWLPLKDLGNALTVADAERIKDSAEEEYRRLLYVAMTRAADRLVVCGYRGRLENKDTWHQMITAALSADGARCVEKTFSTAGESWPGFSWREAGAATLEAATAAPIEDKVKVTLPEALGRPLPPQKSLPRPLSPSGAAAVIETDAADLLVPSALFGRKGGVPGAGLAMERGRILHRFLQVLPAFADAERPAAARRYLERAAAHWPESARTSLVEAALAVIGDEDLAAIFSPAARAEVSIMGTLTLGSRDYAVSGRIDRMAITDAAVEIVDFKTNRVPPASHADIPFEHRAQLAIYRAILMPLYPAREIRCGLIYTEAAKTYWLDAGLMEASLAELASK
ncbi:MULTISPECIES: double-strand break repair helicase AddA [unclassified Shinella]|uniref:double-strand break repair helicase AddA n=1 Tax=unclassified Shinella TaxID=2643062 RepID=UPI00234F8AE9|nr:MULTISPECIES: double-strand break repair helicase AddA [unclassified Shinella]MCO5154331.1 double-strand break repair helicase AddA [Shinella sp.]MDC7264020.1 double-strand break repair helicase AddA [Shinella sp. HY16]MDC7270916.1 double-strand break repair helicase AddA [Shinella sp. YZ44]